MNEDIIKDIELFVKTNLFLEEVPEFKDWYEKEVFYQKIEENLLEKLSKYLIEKYDNFYTLDNLRHITKLFLLYPDGLPNMLKNLNWDLTKIILDIFNEEKREFYIELCYENNLDVPSLKKYLNEEIYEKFLYCLSTYYDSESLKNFDYRDLVSKVISISNRII